MLSSSNIYHPHVFQTVLIVCTNCTKQTWIYVDTLRESVLVQSYSQYENK